MAGQPRRARALGLALLCAAAFALTCVGTNAFVAPQGQESPRVQPQSDVRAAAAAAALAPLAASQPAFADEQNFPGWIFVAFFFGAGIAIATIITALTAGAKR